MTIEDPDQSVINWPEFFLSADIMSSLCGVRVLVNISSETTRPRDLLLILKDTLSIEDDKS